MNTEPGGERPSPTERAPGRQRVRRPVSGGKATSDSSRGERSWGVLIGGGILGILAGVAFAFYGLPPILRHFYGEQHIAAGQFYDRDGKLMKLVGVTPTVSEAAGASPGFVAEFDVTINKTWDAKASDFSIEFAGGGNWVQAAAIGIDQPAPRELASASIDFNGTTLAEPHRLQIVFPAHAGTPKFLHLAMPSVRFALPGPAGQ